MAGTPTTADTYTFTVQVTDRNGRIASQAFSLRVQPLAFVQDHPLTPDAQIFAAVTFNPGAGDSCAVTEFQAIPVDGLGSPPGIAFPHGLLRFTAEQCAAGQSAITVTLAYPAPLPPGTQFWKYGATANNPTPHWYVLPGVLIQGNTVTYTIYDGGLGDNDRLANGTLVDPGGPGTASLTLDGALPASGQVGVAYSGLLSAVDGIGPYVWSVAAGALPPGLGLAATAPASATLSGTPTQAGEYAFTLQVLDQGLVNAIAQRSDALLIHAVEASVYTVTPVAGAGGALQPATAQSVEDGLDTVFQVLPDSGYQLDSISGCDGQLSGQTYRTGPIVADCAVTASFSGLPPDNAPADAKPIPTLGPWALGLLASLLGVLGWRRRLK